MNFFSRNILRLKDRYYLHRYVYPFIKKNKNREISFQNNICLFSFPRSGSTWLSEILLTIPNSCLFDEPLQRNLIYNPNELPRYEIRKIKEAADNKFYYYQPIPTDASEQDIIKMFKTLLSGRALSIGLYDDYGLEKLDNAQVFITKFNYGGLLSSWLIKNFDFASIFLIRNPYACISSIMRHVLGKRMFLPDKIKLPEFKYNELYTNHKNLYNKFKTTEEFYTFLWCLNFLEGFNKNGGKKVLRIYYEELLIDYHNTIKKIFKFLNKPVPEQAFQKRFVLSRSAEKYAEKIIKNEKQIDSWKTILSKEQIGNIKSILDYFEIKEYSDQVFPNYCYE